MADVEPDLVIPSGECSLYGFGDALAAWGDELLVGATFRNYAYFDPNDTSAPPPAPPVCCLFRRVGNAFSHVQTLAPSPAAIVADGFGRALALGSSFAIVGSPGYENGDGPIHQFERAAGGSFQVRALLESPESLDGLSDVLSDYGVAVCCDEDWLIVGAGIESDRRSGTATTEGGELSMYLRGLPATQSRLRCCEARVRTKTSAQRWLSRRSSWWSVLPAQARTSGSRARYSCTAVKLRIAGASFAVSRAVIRASSSALRSRSPARVSRLPRPAGRISERRRAAAVSIYSSWLTTPAAPSAPCPGSQVVASLSPSKAIASRSASRCTAPLRAPCKPAESLSIAGTSARNQCSKLGSRRRTRRRMHVSARRSRSDQATSLPVLRAAAPATVGASLRSKGFSGPWQSGWVVVAGLLIGCDHRDATLLNIVQAQARALACHDRAQACERVFGHGQNLKRCDEYLERLEQAAPHLAESRVVLTEVDAYAHGAGAWGLFELHSPRGDARLKFDFLCSTDSTEHRAEPGCQWWVGDVERR
jgi:hypothetical protein